MIVLASPSPLAGLLPELEHARRFADASTAPATRAAYLAIERALASA